MEEEWARMMEGYVMFEPTIMVFVREDGSQGVSTAVVDGDAGEESALLVFQTYLEARAYQEYTRQGNGYAIMVVDAPRIAALLAKYGLRWVSVPRTFNEGEISPWTALRGTGSLSCWRGPSRSRLCPVPISPSPLGSGLCATHWLLRMADNI